MIAQVAYDGLVMLIAYAPALAIAAGCILLHRRIHA